MSNAHWPMVRLQEVVKQDKSYVYDLEDRLYPKLSVKLYGKGVVLDAPVNGASVRMEKHQLARAGQIIVSEIWAKKGALGIVPVEGNGALVTSHFYLFDVDDTKLDPRWMWWLLRGNYLEVQLGSEAKGTTGYAAVRPSHFLAAQIPLPPLNIQRVIIGQLDSIYQNASEVKSLIEGVIKDLVALLRRFIHLSANRGGRLVPLADLMRLKPPDVIVNPEEEYDLGLPPPRTAFQNRFISPSLI